MEEWEAHKNASRQGEMEIYQAFRLKTRVYLLTVYYQGSKCEFALFSQIC
jgi:hypothetical protein